jgi:hypothetical protein
VLPAIVLPLHDTDGLIFSHLEAVTPQLKSSFAHAFLSITPPTERAQTRCVNQLKEDSFFKLNFNQPNALIGDHFLSAYRNAATACPPTQVLHLCFPDRVAFALQSKHKDQFIADVNATSNAQVPILFQRSRAAWDTHPQNYREIEHIATRVGEMLFNKTLDFTWCHLAIQAQQLKEILPQVKRHDLVILAEIVLILKNKIQTKDVDWLAWEKPFVFSRDPDQLRKEGENSLQETRRRLKYVLPITQLLAESIEK